MNDVLIDTNVLIYAIDADSLFHDRCKRFLDKYSSNLFTSSKNLSEFLSVTTKGNEPKLAHRDAVSTVENFLIRMKILYPNAISFEIFLELMRKYKPKGLKIHDLEIASIAIANQVNVLASINTKDFAKIKEIKLADV